MLQAYSVQLADLPTNADSWTNKEVDTLKGYIVDQTLIEAEVCGKALICQSAIDMAFNVRGLFKYSIFMC